MDQEQVAQFCLGLPGAREDYKWGGVRVFSIAGTKMFALQNLRGESLAFKVDPELFLGHVDRPGVSPAPYLARAHWVILRVPYPLEAAELKQLLQRSHQLVVAKLPKRAQVGLQI
ncbi:MULTISPECIES: MmcQ/YjbR family DNA-binding protein [Pseudomonas]|uniref:MmcQ/YjbR family DNA-binding protein n=1 Tax=Pseudomonas sessilinigenes TaxID=658629 RepID=A0ABX8MIX2_9PSED|nr:MULTISPECIES: MmcQ/YjbR family DNA-binding protein [Pseudomonas]QIH11831.1 MmcQ/YjbR family DNA-binding protein [Pseudomonas sp. BIOMIG1BAC]QXH39244.1 MmcQ/YjbR family DNA-binding protein [Pseudomonas sessilinigenes]UMZ09205.1 MmcQ/YjbR family DNA-binding protein [Pseudomonas sp. MPFS]